MWDKINACFNPRLGIGAIATRGRVLHRVHHRPVSIPDWVSVPLQPARPAAAAGRAAAGFNPRLGIGAIATIA